MIVSQAQLRPEHPSINLQTQQGRLDFFSTVVLRNLSNLSRQLDDRANDIPWFDEKRDNIIRAVSFGLDKAEDSWPLTYALIDKVSPLIERRGTQLGSWAWILEQSIRLAQEQHDLEATISLHHYLARLQLRRGEYKASKASYRQVIRLSRTADQPFTEARACTNLGFFYIEQGNWMRAEVLCRHALALFEQLDSQHGLAHTHNHLGLLYTRCHQWQDAEYHLTLACEIWDNMEDRFGLMDGYMNLGFLYNEMVHIGDFDILQVKTALQYSEAALSHAQILGDELSVGRIKNNMAVSYWLRKKMDKAIIAANEAERIFKKFDYSVGQAQVWNNQGLIYFDQQEWDNAIGLLCQSLDLFEALDNIERIIKLKLDLADCWLRAGETNQTEGLLAETKEFIQKQGYRQYYHHLVIRYKQIRQSLEDALAN